MLREVLIFLGKIFGVLAFEDEVSLLPLTVFFSTT